MTSAVETAPSHSHHRAWYESVSSVPSAASRGVSNEESTADSMAVVDHVNSFYNAVLETSGGARDYRSGGPYSRDVLMSSRHYYQHSPYSSSSVTHSK